MSKYTVNDLGFYGNYGGAYIPEILYKTVEDLKHCLSGIGDWYFTGDYPTPGGYRVLRRSLENHLARREGRSY